MWKRIFAGFLLALLLAPVALAQVKPDPEQRYLLLATKKTSTMQKELQEAAALGFRVVTGSPTSGTEMAVFLEREPNSDKKYDYKLLATTLTGTLQKEVTESLAAGYVIAGMVSRGEHMVIMEREGRK